MFDTESRYAMKIDPESRHAQLTAAAERIYGDERAEQLADQIEHLAKMMSEVSRMELSLTDEPLPGPIAQDRGRG
jgi:hypothetical protein